MIPLQVFYKYEMTKRSNPMHRPLQLIPTKERYSSPLHPFNSDMFFLSKFWKSEDFPDFINLSLLKIKFGKFGYFVTMYRRKK